MTGRTGVIFLMAVALVYLAIFSGFVNSHNNGNGSKKNNKNNVCTSIACRRSAALLKKCMNMTADPCEDFSEYTCGNFFNIKPPSGNMEVRDWFTEVQVAVMREIKSYLTTKTTPGDPQAVQKARSLYQMCMDGESLAKYGLDTLKNYLNRVGLTTALLKKPNSKTTPWYRTAANLKKFTNIDFLLEVSVQKDPLDRSIKRITLSRPSNNDLMKQSFKDYDNSNVKSDGNNEAKSHITNQQEQEINPQNKLIMLQKKVRYKRHVDAVMTAIGYRRVSMYRLENIHNFQNSCNQILTQTKDENYILVTIKHLQEMTAGIKFKKDNKPMIDWMDFLNLFFNGYIQESDIVYVTDVNYIVAIMTMLSNVDMATIRYAMFWEVITKLLPNSRRDLSNRWNAYVTAVTGRKVGKTRMTYCLTTIVDMMGTALAYKYVRERGVNKNRMQIRFMAKNIYESFKQSFKENSWIDPQTKDSILKKLYNITTFVGFPAWLANVKLLDRYYSDIIVIEHEFMKSLVENEILTVKKKFEKYKPRVTEAKWKKQKYLMNPVTVRAFYNPKINAINIPVAIMRFPLYNYGLQALNYGSLGTLLAHEISHGFDSTGMKFDDADNVKDLWTKITETEFNKRANCFVKYYDNLYVKEAQSTVNGAGTLAENIADNVGFKHALKGYRRYVATKGKELLLPGFEEFSHEKLFTIAYGIIKPAN